MMDRLLGTGQVRRGGGFSIAAQYLFWSARDNFMSLLKAAPRRKRLEQLKLQDDEVLPDPRPEPGDPRASGRRADAHGGAIPGEMNRLACPILVVLAGLLAWPIALY